VSISQDGNFKEYKPV